MCLVVEKMCTADTIITIATRENMGVSSMSFFFSFFLFGRPNFLFILLLVPLPLVDGILILSDRCSSGLLLYYYYFFFFAYFGIKKGGSSYSFTSTLQRKSIHFPSIFLTQVFFIRAQTVVGRPDGGKRE